MLQTDPVEKVKVITLKDNKNNEEKYMLLERILGKGKFAKVYKAVHMNNPDKVFAVKVIEFTSQKSKQQYLRELQIILHLPNSLNLVKIHSQHLESKNNFYLFEEYCNGGNLYEQRQARKGNPYTQQQVYNIFFQIVNGFLDLRKANIFHEDIKPQNILIKNNIYKLTDFGISQLSDKIQVSEIRRGTLIYMPPQKLKAGPFCPTSKSQIFSLGITLFETIFGHHPYLKKKPADYKEYLKLINQTPVKSAQQLKKIFSSRSLCIDRLIKIIFRMIQLNEAKRLTIQELQDYVKNTEPFKSMEISENEPMSKKKIDKSIKYEEIGHSHIIVKSQNGMGSFLKQKKIDKESLLIVLDICKVCLQFFRDTSGFIQQGFFYLRDSKIYELKQIQQNSSVFQLNKISKVSQLEFMSLLLIEKIFIEFEKSMQNFIFMSNIETNQDQFMNSIELDRDYISNQFLKFYMDIEVENKKSAWSNLKEKGILLTEIICSSFQKIFDSITSVRINFKQDMLGILFIKFAPEILRLAKKMIDVIISGEKDKLREIIGSSDYSKSTNLLMDYSTAQTEKKNKLLKIFEQKMNSKQIMEDDESNQDEFQVLDIKDLE